MSEAARFAEASLALQVLRNGNRVGRLAGGRQSRNRLEDQLVVGTVEVLTAQDVRDLAPGGGIEQQPAEHRLLRLQRVRRRGLAVRSQPRHVRSGAARG